MVTVARSLVTAVFGGMIAAAVLAVFFVPVFSAPMQRPAEWRAVRDGGCACYAGFPGGADRLF